MEANQNLKERKGEGRIELQFQVEDLVMVYLNKAKLQKGIPRKLYMIRIGPYKILEKYRPNAYKIDLTKDMSLSPISNVKDLVPYRGPKMDDIG